ncbi:glycosyltransferase [Candidatus Parcubacteria bacterium]|nr:glycosyltransferase [Candidatus Parcubacteria bacterium]
MGYTLSIIVPAHKEKSNLMDTVSYVMSQVVLLRDLVTDWEIIIVDSLEKDGSNDGTPQIADKLSVFNQQIKVIHNNGYVNLGHKYWQGVAKAQLDYVCMVPGKNTLHGDSIVNLVKALPDRGIAIGYQDDMSRRPWQRRVISKSFTAFMNLVFRLDLTYYNGTTIIPTALLRSLNLNTTDFAYMAEILVTLIKKRNLPYAQAPFYTRGRRSYGKTRALKFDNILSVSKTVTKLFKTIYFY